MDVGLGVAGDHGLGRLELGYRQFELVPDHPLDQVSRHYFVAAHDELLSEVDAQVLEANDHFPVDALEAIVSSIQLVIRLQELGH